MQSVAITNANAAAHIIFILSLGFLGFLGSLERGSSASPGC